MIRLSKESVLKAIHYSKETENELKKNTRIFDDNVNSQFINLIDPTFKKYLELSEKMQEMLTRLSMKIGEISDYCESVIRWIDQYNKL